MDCSAIISTILNSTGGVASHPALPIFGDSRNIGTTDYIDDGNTIDGGKKIVLGVQNGGDDGGAIHIVNLNSAGGFVSSSVFNEFDIEPTIPTDQRFGSGVTALGDMDGDGINDILVGNTLGDDTNFLSGEVYILFLNSTDGIKETQKISNTSEFERTGANPFAASDLFGHGMTLWQENGTTAVIMISAHQDDAGLGAAANAGAIYFFYIERTPGAVTVQTTSTSSGSCSDCSPPTFGLNKNGKLLVTNGFTYNGISTDVKNYFTPFPLITVVTNQTNTLTVKVYENRGAHSIKNIQFGMGMPQVGSPLNDAQTLLEVWIDNTVIAEIIKIDKNNLVDIINATTSLVGCTNDDGSNCLQLTLNYIYRDQPKYNIMLINSMDSRHNTWNHYLNDGILVIGDSINEPKTLIVAATKGGALYPQKSGTVTLSLDDYKNDIWLDKFGYKWSTNQYGPYLLDAIPVPETIPDKYSKWSGYNDRWHSEFPRYVQVQIQRAEVTLEDLYPYHFMHGDVYVPEVITYDYVIDRIDRKNVTSWNKVLLEEATKAEKIRGPYSIEPINFTYTKEINQTNVSTTVSKFIEEYKYTS